MTLTTTFFSEAMEEAFQDISTKKSMELLLESIQEGIKEKVNYLKFTSILNLNNKTKLNNTIMLDIHHRELLKTMNKGKVYSRNS